MNVGDKVQFTNIIRKGSAIDMRTVNGEIVAIDGDIITVKYGGNHRRKKLKKSALRPIAAKTELTEFVENVISETRTG